MHSVVFEILIGWRWLVWPACRWCAVEEQLGEEGCGGIFPASENEAEPCRPCVQRHQQQWDTSVSTFDVLCVSCFVL